MPTYSITTAGWSIVIARIKGKNTKPEPAVWPALHRCGFRLHRKALPGKIARGRREYEVLEESGWCIETSWECALKGKIRLTFESVVDQCPMWLMSDIIKLEVGGDKTRTIV